MPTVIGSSSTSGLGKVMSVPTSTSPHAPSASAAAASSSVRTLRGDLSPAFIAFPRPSSLLPLLLRLLFRIAHEADEGAAVAVAQRPHQRGEAVVGVLRHVRRHRETDAVDAH